jgi:hypothetical protein
MTEIWSILGGRAGIHDNQVSIQRPKQIEFYDADVLYELGSAERIEVYAKGTYCLFFGESGRS